jgi:hypothetical protein
VGTSILRGAEYSTVSNDEQFTDTIPPQKVDVSGVTLKEIDPAAAGTLTAFGVIASGILEHWLGIHAASMVESAATVTAILSGDWDKMMALVGKFFKASQGEQNSGFYDLAAAVLEDLTGVPVDAAKLKSSTFGSGRLAGMEAFGGDLYKLLEQEFAPASGNLEEGSVAPAERFLGFLMNFAIRQGNVSVMCEALPQEMKFITGFRDYGEQMAKMLGLGRLARRGFQPLVQILVAEPLTLQLNEQYRPKRIAKEQAIKKFFRDPSFETQARKEMAQEGFSDDRIGDLIDDARPLLAEREIIAHAFRFGATTSGIPGALGPDVKADIMKRGYSETDAQRLIELGRPILKENEIGLLYVNQAIDRQTALDHMSQLGYDDTTGQLALQAHSLSHQHAHRIGLGMLRKMLHDNVIDVLEFGAHLSAQGYSADDINLLQLEFLQPTDRQVRQLSLAEIKAGFKAGALTEPQAAQHLKTLGYSDTDVEVILKSLPTGKKPAAPATPAG